MTPDERANRLVEIADELALRVRNELPADYADWLWSVTDEQDRRDLLFIQAAANQPGGFAKATAWVRQVTPVVDEIAVERARRGEKLPLTRLERLAVVADMVARGGHSDSEIGLRAGMSRRQVQRFRAGQIQHVEQLAQVRAQAVDDVGMVA